MEKKKILLVAVSVGVFLVIIISASILIFTPKNTGLAAAPARPVSVETVPVQPGFSPQGNNPAGRVIPEVVESPISHPASVDAADMVRNAAGIQSIQIPPNATAIQETNFYISGEKPSESYSVTNTNGNSRVVINVPKPSTAAVPAYTAPPVKPVQNLPAAKPAQVSAPVQKAQSVPAAKPAVTAVPAPAKPAATVKSTPQPKTYNDYWVQTGAFSAKIRAEGMKDTLASKGITSIIENTEVDGKSLYRVRVGPYTSENEASYWAGLVKSIDGFGDSQIRQSTSRR
jgi:DedD protein